VNMDSWPAGVGRGSQPPIQRLGLPFESGDRIRDGKHRTARTMPSQRTALRQPHYASYTQRAAIPATSETRKVPRMTDHDFGGAARSMRWWLAAAVPLLLLVGACTSDDPSQVPAAESQYNSFEEISAKLGCESLIAEEKMDSHVLENKVCVLPALSEGGIGIFQFADATQRDATIQSQSTGGSTSSYLVLSDTWMLAGNSDDVVTARDKLGAGEVRTPDPSTTGGSPTEESLPDVIKVPVGKSATFKGEQVRLDKIRCGVKPTNKLSDSCRMTNLGKIVSNPEWGGKNDPNYELPEYIDAKAPKGDEFYLVAFRWKNVGKKPIYPSSFGTLVTATGSEYEAEEEYQYTLTRDASGNQGIDTTDEFNPGKGYRQILVYTIPKGTKVASINWGLDDFDNTPTYTFAVK
jgi:hypothetical protein